jgi:BlaI family transcriptional regulator, penicillinase repressor
MPPDAPNISDSEWLIASIVWDHPDLTSQEIADRLDNSVKWKLKTVNTFLARLTAKGVLKIERDGRAFRYHARIPREQCVRAESESFLKRVFGGAIAPMLTHFCETADLTDEDLAALRLILARKRETPSKKKPNSPRPKKS